MAVDADEGGGKQNSTNLGRKSCRMSTLPMSRNSMSGKVALKVSLPDALQNAGGRKPSAPSACTPPP